MSEILVLEGARTPFCVWAGGMKAGGEKGGALKPLDPTDLGAIALKAALERGKLLPSAVGHVIFGNAYAVGSHATFAPRYLAQRAGVPANVPGVTITAACASGLQAVVEAAHVVARGDADVVAAAGADSSSNVPRAVFIPSFKDQLCGKQIAEISQDMSKGYGVSRAEQDSWALESHRRASAARARGVFAEEIVEAGGQTADDGVLDSPTPEHFASSKILFEGYDATAANTHGVVDGGAALLFASPNGARAAADPLGRVAGSAIVGVPSDRMPYASVSAVRKALLRAGWEVEGVDLWEINETFASQTLVAVKELGLSADRVNVNGGALALGHPFGATGPRLVLTLLKELRRRGKRRGVAAICAGAGTGVAVAVETV